ncbi:MAG: PilZ domain-containing protein [Candidatus Omnitrophica bacterium]|nr:PilZ domain-containing protein [Candidatus Omnitrophota bacterium]
MALSGAVCERRKFVRMYSDFPVQLKYMKPNTPIQIHNSLSQDLSEGGLQISSYYFYPVNSQMIVELQLNADTVPIKTVGKVVWVEQLPYQDVFKLGIEFSELSVFNQKALRQLIADKFDLNQIN